MTLIFGATAAPLLPKTVVALWSLPLVPRLPALEMFTAPDQSASSAKGRVRHTL